MQFLMEDWFWAMTQAIGVILTLIVIYKQIRIQTSSHVVQTLQAIHTRWTEEPMRWARFKVCSSYLDGKFEFGGEADYIAEFLEELGGYIKINAVTRDAMWDAQSWNIEHYYCMFKSGIERSRLTFHDDNLYENTESLFRAMAEHSKQRGATSSQRGDEDLRRFAQYEVQVTSPFLPEQRDV
jgi:hypothetical protein